MYRIFHALELLVVGAKPRHAFFTLIAAFGLVRDRSAELADLLAPALTTAKSRLILAGRGRDARLSVALFIAPIHDHGEPSLSVTGALDRREQVLVEEALNAAFRAATTRLERHLIAYRAFGKHMALREPPISAHTLVAIRAGRDPEA